MAKTKESNFEKPIPAQDDENEATLAAFDEGLRHAKEGRLVPAEQGRKFQRPHLS
jgi:predicted transcriptional regulator